VPIVAPHRPATATEAGNGSGRWEVGDMTMLGTDAVASAPVEVFPSDHFGLVTTLRRISD
jgi:hypothetical protein